MKSTTGFYYTSGLRIIWILVFVLVFLSNKLELHKIINSFHSPFLDVFAPIATNVGDGLFLILISCQDWRLLWLQLCTRGSSCGCCARSRKKKKANDDLPAGLMLGETRMNA
jgi:hypothetical protein